MSMSSLPVDWWRRTWSSPSHYRQVLTWNWSLLQTWRVLEQPMFPLLLLSTLLSHFWFPKAKRLSFNEPKTQTPTLINSSSFTLTTSCVHLTGKFQSVLDTKPHIWMNSFFTVLLFLKCRYWILISLKYYLYELYTIPGVNIAFFPKQENPSFYLKK